MYGQDGGAFTPHPQAAPGGFHPQPMAAPTPHPMPAPGGRGPAPLQFARNQLLRILAANPQLFSGGAGDQMAQGPHNLLNQFHFVTGQLWNQNHPGQIAAARAAQAARSVTHAASMHPAVSSMTLPERIRTNTPQGAALQEAMGIPDPQVQLLQSLMGRYA